MAGKRFMRCFANEGKIHVLFRIFLWVKGAFATSEILSGIAIYFVTQQSLVRMVNLVTGHEFAEDPQDLFIRYLRQAVQHFSGDTRHFASYYLLGHGIVKLWLIAGLLKRRLWYYPVAIAVFGLFIVYQLYRFSFTHSVSLLLITAVDLAIMILTWTEFRYLRRRSMPDKPDRAPQP